LYRVVWASAIHFYLENYTIHFFRSSSYVKLSESDLSLKSTWDCFYQSPSKQSFEWFLESKDVVPRLQKLLQNSDELLLKKPHLTLIDVGCGTSSVFPSLYVEESKSPLNLSCIDFSEKAISTLRHQFASAYPSPGHPHSLIDFVVAETKALPYSSDSVDVILDKGLSDAVLRSKDKGAFSATWKEFLRVLNCNGIGKVLQISDEDPDVQVLVLEQEMRKRSFDFSVDYQVVTLNDFAREMFCYVVYCYSKKVSQDFM